MDSRDFSIVAGETVRRVSDIRTNDEEIFPNPPSVGLVVGTFASVAYIHLHLEARSRFYPTIPLLIHDDGSPKQEELRELCERYECEFERNDRRQPPCVGDVSCFLGGLLWAERKGLGLVVKMSRRFLPLRDWVPELQRLAIDSQYPTYCSYTDTFGFGFRSECVGMAVNEWVAHKMPQELARIALDPHSPFVEAEIHNLARRLASFRCRRAVAWDEEQRGPRPDDRNGYAPWDFMGTDRCTKYAGYLWHDSATPREYHGLSRLWDLPYSEQDFIDPNQGLGNGT